MNIGVKHRENILNVESRSGNIGGSWTLYSFGYLYYLVLGNTLL